MAIGGRSSDPPGTGGDTSERDDERAVQVEIARIRAKVERNLTIVRLLPWIVVPATAAVTTAIFFEGASDRSLSVSLSVATTVLSILVVPLAIFKITWDRRQKLRQRRTIQQLEEQVFVLQKRTTEERTDVDADEHGGEAGQEADDRATSAEGGGAGGRPGGPGIGVGPPDGPADDGAPVGRGGPGDRYEFVLNDGAIVNLRGGDSHNNAALDDKGWTAAALAIVLAAAVTGGCTVIAVLVDGDSREPDCLSYIERIESLDENYDRDQLVALFGVLRLPEYEDECGSADQIVERLNGVNEAGTTSTTTTAAGSG